MCRFILLFLEASAHLLDKVAGVFSSGFVRQSRCICAFVFGLSGLICAKNVPIRVSKGYRSDSRNHDDLGPEFRPTRAHRTTARHRQRT